MHLCTRIDARDAWAYSVHPRCLPDRFSNPFTPKMLSSLTGGGVIQGFAVVTFVLPLHLKYNEYRTVSIRLVLEIVVLLKFFSREFAQTNIPQRFSKRDYLLCAYLLLRFKWIFGWVGASVRVEGLKSKIRGKKLIINCSSIVCAFL